MNKISQAVYDLLQPYVVHFGIRELRLFAWSYNSSCPDYTNSECAITHTTKFTINMANPDVVLSVNQYFDIPIACPMENIYRAIIELANDYEFEDHVSDKNLSECMLPMKSIRAILKERT